MSATRLRLPSRRALLCDSRGNASSRVGVALDSIAEREI